MGPLQKRTRTGKSFRKATKKALIKKLGRRLGLFFYRREVDFIIFNVNIFKKDQTAKQTVREILEDYFGFELCRYPNPRHMKYDKLGKSDDGSGGKEKLLSYPVNILRLGDQSDDEVLELLAGKVDGVNCQPHWMQ